MASAMSMSWRLDTACTIHLQPKSCLRMSPDVAFTVLSRLLMTWTVHANAFGADDQVEVLDIAMDNQISEAMLTGRFDRVRRHPGPRHWSYAGTSTVLFRVSGRLSCRMPATDILGVDHLWV